MSIRFSCTTCGQRLSVGTHRAGQKSTCPKCKTTLRIPQTSGETSTLVATQKTVQPQMAMLSLTDEPANETAQIPELVQETIPANGNVHHSATAELDLIAVPRYVIFTQGFLLVCVGIVCFLIGLAVGSAVAPGNAGRATVEKMMLTGTVALLEKGKRSGDVGAMVTLIPFDALPETKGSIVGLRPGDSADSMAANEFLKALGGANAQCDERGRFEMQLRRGGKYYVLVVSSTGSLRSRGPIPQQQLGQMSKFFDMASEPLENFRFQWRIENVRSETPLNIDFD